MKNLAEVLTNEQKQQFRNIYIIGANKLAPLTEENDPPSIENFKAICVADDGEAAIVTAEDFYWYNEESGDKDFKYTVEGDYISRDNLTDEFCEFLDSAIEAGKEVKPAEEKPAEEE